MLITPIVVHESKEFVEKFLLEMQHGNIPLLLNKNSTQVEIDNILSNINVLDKRFVNDKYFLLCTSGTTGYTKLVVHTYDNIIKTGKQFAKVLGATSKDVFFSASKMFHAYGLGNSLSIPQACDASVVYCDELITPKLACEIIEKNGVTVFCGVPRHFASMVNSSIYPKNSKLRICLSAGEKLPRNIAEQFEKNTGVKIIDAVGSTEALGFMIVDGKKMEDVDLKFVDEELYMKSNSMFHGYYNDIESTNYSIRDGWLKTGDLYDYEDGIYTYKGRANDLVKINGSKVYLNILEQRILLIDGVKECAITTYTNKNDLMRLKLYLVCDNLDHVKPHINEIAKEYRTTLLIELKDELPRTATGKIRKYSI